MPDRHLDWDGCCNVRDLGGLPTVDGATTAWGAIVRSDNPAHLTPAGWRALLAHGVRTVIALRTTGSADDEPDPALVPAGVTVQRVTVEDGTDPRFVAECVDTMRFATPIYFRQMLERWPHLCADAVTAVAAAPRAVVVSCGRGCDRTGLASFLLLALADVTPEAIAADWTLSVGRLARCPRHRRDASDPFGSGYEAALAEVLARERTTVLDTIVRTLAEVDISQRLRDGGATDDVLRRARSLLRPPAPGEEDVPGIRTTLRRHLKERMLARDTAAVDVLRAAIAAVDNAEAAPLLDPRPNVDPAVPAVTEVPRRVVTDHEARAVVATERDRLCDAADRYRAIGEVAAATVAEAQADVLSQILAPERRA